MVGTYTRWNEKEGNKKRKTKIYMRKTVTKDLKKWELDKSRAKNGIVWCLEIFIYSYLNLQGMEKELRNDDDEFDNNYYLINHR